MTPVHFMGREIGWFVTDRLGVCRYRSRRSLWLDLDFGMADQDRIIKGKV